jgi:CelD/BcsL family acetyltransferase involved in cellulose biosynthesis
MARVRTISTREDFMSLQEEWDALATAQTSPFVGHAIVSAWWDAFGGNRRLHAYGLWENGRLAAALPLFDDGRRLEAMVEPDLPALPVVWRDEGSLQGLVSSILAADEREIKLARVPKEHPLLRALVHPDADRRLRLIQPGHTAPILDTTGDFEDYRRRTRPTWQSRLDAYARKMERDYDATIELIEAPASVDDALESGFRLEASGWKGRAGTAVLSSPAMTSFYRSLVRIFLDQGKLRISRIILDGSLVAFDLAVRHGASLYSLKTGFDESYRRLSPGLVLRMSIIRRCFEADVEAYEFLGPAYAWTRNFTSSGRDHVTVRLYSRSPAGALVYAYRRSLHPVLRRAVRRGRNPAAWRRASSAQSRRGCTSP